MKMKTKKIESSDIFVMNNVPYQSLLEIYQNKISNNKKIIKNGNIGITINDSIFKSLSEGMRSLGLLSPLDKHISKRSAEREAEYQRELKIWNKLNRELKKRKEEGYIVEIDTIKYIFKMIG